MSDDAEEAAKIREERRKARMVEICDHIMENPAQFNDFMERAAPFMEGGKFPTNATLRQQILTVAANWLANIDLDNRKTTLPGDLVDGLILGLEYLGTGGKKPTRGRN